MTSTAERKFINLRKRLDQLGYRQPLGIESLPLVEKLFSDLVHTTESLRNAKLSVGKTEKESKNLDAVLEPYKSENARLVRENNELHLDLLKLKEGSDQQIRDLKATVRKLEHDTADLKFLNNQYVHKVRSLEKDSKAKTEKIQQLQEKNLQAVVQTPGGKKRTIPFRRQRMQIDQPVPPSELTSPPVAQADDPYIADLLQVADNRIQELQQEVIQLKEDLERSERGIKNLNKQVEVRDQEIERLGQSLCGGRPHDVISIEARNKSNEKLIDHLNLQIEYLQQANRDLEKHLQDALQTKKSATSEVVNLSAKNEELCQELTEIDKLAQQLERDKEIVLETADQELQEAKNEFRRWQKEMQILEDTVAALRTELSACHGESEKLRTDLCGKMAETENLHNLIEQIEKEKQRLSDRVDKLTITEKELVLELERMRTQHGILHRDRSPSRLDAFVKSLEEEKDFYRGEMEYLQKLVRGRQSPLRTSGQSRSPTRRSPARGSTQDSDITQIIRERDELRSILDKVERHMVEIQTKVKVLTAEKDELNRLYLQTRDELNRLRKESLSPQMQKSALTVQTALHHVEKERDEALSDLKKMVAERETLREKIKTVQDSAVNDKIQMEKTVEELGNTIHLLEDDRSDLRSRVSLLKDTIISLENQIKNQSQRFSQSSEDTAHQKAELNSFRVLNEQLEKSLADVQRRFSGKTNELQMAQQQIAKLEERIDELCIQETSRREEINVMRNTVSALDKEKDSLQEAVDEKTEKIAYLEDNLTNKDKTISNLRLTLSELESSIRQIQDTLSTRDRELASLRRQLDSAHQELNEVGRTRDISLRENRRLQDDLATMTRENQAITAELEEVMHEKDELKLRVHSYISEVARIESVIASKERENRELLDQFQMAHILAEDWEVKAHQAEGENSSVRLELLSVDTERKHLREKVESLEKQIQEYMNGQQAYEHQISSLAKSMTRLEEELRQAHNEKSSILADIASVRELCVKLDSSKELISRQLTSKCMESERVMGELEDVKSEAELLKKQLASERLTIKNLETLLATNREKEFQSHLTSHERESEIQILKDKLMLAESKTTSQIREIAQLRSKAAQLQMDLDIAKRQLTTERFERERAVQEMRRHGLSTSSLRTSSPLDSSPRSHSHSPEHSALKTPEQSTDKSTEKSVSFKEQS